MTSLADIARGQAKALVGAHGKLESLSGEASINAIAEAFEHALHRLVWSDVPDNTALARELAKSVEAIEYCGDGVNAGFYQRRIDGKARNAVATLIQRAICMTRTDDARIAVDCCEAIRKAYMHCAAKESGPTRTFLLCKARAVSIAGNDVEHSIVHGEIGLLCTRLPGEASETLGTGADTMLAKYEEAEHIAARRDVTVAGIAHVLGIPAEDLQREIEAEAFDSPEQMVGAEGLEPSTTRLEGECSIHLSYAPTGNQQSSGDDHRQNNSTAPDGAE